MTMLRISTFLFMTLALPMSVVQSAGHIINPDGIPGTIILSRSVQLDDIASKTFLNRGGGQKSVAILLGSDTVTADVNPFIAVCRQNDLHEIRLIPWKSTAPLSEDQISILAHSNRIWIAGIGEINDSLLNCCKRVLQQDGCLCFSGSACKLPFSLTEESEDPVPRWNLIPDSLLLLSKSNSQEFAASLANNRDPKFGIQLRDQGCVEFKGRRIRSLSKPPAALILPQSTLHPQFEFEIHQRPVDLTATRRAVRERMETLDGPRKPRKPRVESGALLIAGGGKLSEEITDAFVDFAGGENAVIVILPTAAPDPLPNSHWMEKTFRNTKAREVVVLPQRKRKDVESEEFLSVLNRATGIWFGGGRQWRFVDAYAGSQAEHALRQVLARGGIIGGSSAGASIQGEYLARGNPLGNEQIMSEGYEAGFGYLPGVAIDQHFSQRGRMKDLKSLVAQYPNYLGIGIDESTAIFVQKTTATVFGKGRVFFLNSRDGEIQVAKKSHGDSYSFVED